MTSPHPRREGVPRVARQDGLVYPGTYERQAVAELDSAVPSARADEHRVATLRGAKRLLDGHEQV